MTTKLTPVKDLEYGLGVPPERRLLEPGAEGVSLERYAAIVAERDTRGEGHIWLVRQDGTRETFEQRIVRHSPTGMEFGYGGSGPADLAANILALVVPMKEAWRLHQDFKSDLMARYLVRDGGRLPIVAVIDWVQDRYRAERANPEMMAVERQLRELAAADAEV